MVNVLGFPGSAPGRSTPGCIAGSAATRRRLLHARRGSAPPRDPRVSSPPGRTRAADGTAAPPPADRPGDPGRSAHRAGTSPSRRHKRFRSSESSLQANGKRRATTKRLRNRELVLWILPTGWLLPTGERAIYLTPMVDTTNIGPLGAQLQATLFYLAEGERLLIRGAGHSTRPVSSTGHPNCSRSTASIRLTRLRAYPSTWRSYTRRIGSSLRKQLRRCSRTTTASTSPSGSSGPMERFVTSVASASRRYTGRGRSSSERESTSRNRSI